MIESGFVLGHYRIIRSLGSGGMADVYEAEDTRLGRRLALKVLPPELTRSGDLIERFEKEVRAAAALSHPNIVTLFEFGHEPPYHYYTMQLLPGGDLRERMRQSMPLTEAMKAIRGVAEAFNHAHKRGFVHRDVKPENILFDEEGTPVLTDFGIAKAIDSQTRMTKTGMSVGTPRYISPEQIRGKDVDGRADLYALGCILYEMLSGEPPYDAPDTMAIVFKHVSEPIPQLPADYAQLQPLLDSLMAKDPAERCPDARTLIQQLDALFPRDWTGQISHMDTKVLAGAHTVPGNPALSATAEERLAASAPTQEVENLPPAAPVDDSHLRLTAELMTPASGVVSATPDMTPTPPAAASPPPAAPAGPPPAAPADQGTTAGAPAAPEPSSLSVPPRPQAAVRRKAVGPGSTRPRGRGGLWLGLAGICALGAAGTGWYLLQQAPSQLPVAAGPATDGPLQQQAERKPQATPAPATPAPVIAATPRPTAVVAARSDPAPTAAPKPSPIVRTTPRPTAAPRPTPEPVQQAALAPPRQSEPAREDPAQRARQREAAAQELLTAAQKHQREGALRDAELAYQRIVSDYADTGLLRAARDGLRRLEEQREQARQAAIAAERARQRQRAASGLLEQGQAQQRRDDLRAARSTYASLLNDYSDLPEARTARDRIEDIDRELARREAAQATPPPAPQKARDADKPPPMIGF